MATNFRSKIAFGELTIETDAATIIEVLTFLRDDKDCAFFSFIDLAGADYPGRAQRFEVVYHLMSPTKNTRIRVKLRTDEDSTVPQLPAFFPARTGSSAKLMIFSASCSLATRTCGGC